MTPESGPTLPLFASFLRKTTVRSPSPEKVRENGNHSIRGFDYLAGHVFQNKLLNPLMDYDDDSDIDASAMQLEDDEHDGFLVSGNDLESSDLLLQGLSPHHNFVANHSIIPDDRSMKSYNSNMIMSLFNGNSVQDFLESRNSDSIRNKAHKVSQNHKHLTQRIFGGHAESIGYFPPNACGGEYKFCSSLDTADFGIKSEDRENISDNECSKEVHRSCPAVIVKTGNH